MQLNVYLFDPEVAEFERVFRSGQLPPEGPYEEVPLIQPAPFEGRAFLLRNKQNPPPWLDFFREHCAFEDPDRILNQSNSFILVLKSGERIFALTHGQGYLALERDLAVPGFGLSIAVNSVDPQRIRSTESRNLRETATLKQLVLSRPGDLDQFEVNFNRELLYRLEGGLGRPEVGTRIRGAASCGVATTVEFGELGVWCRRLLEILGQETPRAMERTERLRRVTAPELIATLNQLLDEALRSGGAEALHLSPANIREYNQVEKYQLKVGDQDPVVLDELDIDLVYPHLRGLSRTDVAGTEVRLSGLDAEGEEVTSQPLRTAVIFETLHDGERYVHTPEGWVKVSPSLVDWVNRQLEILATPPRDYDLPDWTARHPNEGEYNRLVAEDSPDFYYCLDKKLVTVEGRSRIEVCDLLNRSGDLIHVKEYKGSSQAITHLVAQAEGSSELLLDDRSYREKIRQQLPGRWSELVAVDRFTPVAHRIVLAVGAPPDRAVPESLPFLSKQSLLRAVESLTLQGFQAFVCPIVKTG